MDIGARDGIMGIVRAGNYGIREVVDIDTIYEAFLKFLLCSGIGRRFCGLLDVFVYFCLFILPVLGMFF